MNANTLKQAFSAIGLKMDENRDYLIQLDQQNGDGDLGISMSEGYRAVCLALAESSETDLGKLLKKSAFAFNEAAPSSLGTITTMILLGMAKTLNGKDEATLAELAEAIEAGTDNVMKKTGSKAGEKTILDAILPAVKVLKTSVEQPRTALKLAAEAAAAGSESTRDMLPVHGRAAYYGERGLGILDGGSAAGRLIFEALAAEFC